MAGGSPRAPDQRPAWLLVDTAVYLATHGGPASYDPLACCLTRRTAMYRERDAETSF
jgi:hypothetical protein